MLSLVLKLGEERIMFEVKSQDIRSLLDVLKMSVILDSDGGTWEIRPEETLYFEAYPPHFEIDCKPKNDQP